VNVRRSWSVAHGRDAQPWSVVVTVNVLRQVGVPLWPEPGVLEATPANASEATASKGTRSERFMRSSPFLSVHDF
jgi:hypothetical protein